MRPGLDKFESRRRRRSRRAGTVKAVTPYTVTERTGGIAGPVFVPYITVMDSEALGGAVVPEANGRRNPVAYVHSQGSALLHVDWESTQESLPNGVDLRGAFVDSVLIGTVAGISSNISPPNGPLLTRRNGRPFYAAEVSSPTPVALGSLSAPSPNAYVLPLADDPVQEVALPVRGAELNHSFVDEFFYRTVFVAVLRNTTGEPLPQEYEFSHEYRVWLVQGGASG